MTILTILVMAIAGYFQLARVMEPTKCGRCGSVCHRSAIHDVEFCAACDEWNEVVCDDTECSSCAGRPARPSEVAR